MIEGRIAGIGHNGAVRRVRHPTRGVNGTDVVENAYIAEGDNQGDNGGTQFGDFALADFTADMFKRRKQKKMWATAVASGIQNQITEYFKQMISLLAGQRRSH